MLVRRACLVAVAAAVALTGCGEGDPKKVPSGARAPISPGDYESGKFEPKVSFEVPEGWQTAGAELPDVLDLARRGKDATVTFARISEVFNSSAKGKFFVPPPKDMISFFTEHPRLEAGKPTKVEVGNASGMQVDATVKSVGKLRPEECNDPCLGIFRDSNDLAYKQFQGYRARYIVVDVEGKPVTIALQAPDQEFEEFTKDAQEILDTVEFDS